jgi:hypothetical protein
MRRRSLRLETGQLSIARFLISPQPNCRDIGRENRDRSDRRFDPIYLSLRLNPCRFRSQVGRRPFRLDHGQRPMPRVGIEQADPDEKNPRNHNTSPSLAADAVFDRER